MGGGEWRDFGDGGGWWCGDGQMSERTTGSLTEGRKNGGIATRFRFDVEPKARSK